MLFGFGFKNKTVKELRKNQGLTAKELAVRLKTDTVEILKIDEMKIKDVAEPYRNRLIPILKGNHTDKMPWL